MYAEISADTTGLEKGLARTKSELKETAGAADKTTSSASGLGKQMQAIATAGAFAVVGRQALAFGQASVAAFSDTEEAYGKFNVVFGEFARSTEKDLDAIAEATGRSKYELIDYASTIQDTFVPLGFAREEAAKMSTSITQLAIDLASFNNLETGDVVKDLQSALVGNTETLRKYGVVAQEAQIKQEALNLGLWDGIGAIDAQTKAQAILSLTYKGTTDAQGDAIRTSDSYANKQRALEAATLDLKVAIGEGLVPALSAATSAVIPYINAVANNISVSNEWENAVNDGIITIEAYTYWHDRAADIYDTESEAYAYLTRATENHNAALEESLKLTPRELQLQRSLAQMDEYAAEKKKDATLAMQRYGMSIKNAIAPTQEFTDKTGMSAGKLRELADAAAAMEFNTLFTDALDDNTSAYGRWVTTATAVGGRTDEQEANFEDLTSAAERLRENINSLQGGTAGLGLSEEDLNKKLTENYEKLAQVEGAMAPLASITTEYTDAQSRWVVDADALNEKLFNQVANMSDNAVVTASAAIAFGLYDEAQISAALNAAIMEEQIKALAEEFVNGEINAGQMKERMDEIVENSPYTSEIDVLVADAVSNIDKVKSKLDAINGLVAKASIIVTTENRTSGSASDAAGGSNDGTPGGGGGGGNPGGGGRGEYATGGVVPGPVGMPQLAVVHGGEEVLTPAQRATRGSGASSISISFDGAIFQGTSQQQAAQMVTMVAEQLGALQ